MDTAYGAMQMGYVSTTNSSMTNRYGHGSIQMMSSNSVGRALMTGQASIGLGAVDVTNDNAIVLGDGLKSHGDGSLTAKKVVADAFIGDGSGLTGVIASAVVGASITYVTNHHTVATNDYTVLCDASLQGITNSLPNATNLTGRILTFKRLDVGTNNYVTISPITGQLIDGQTNVSLYQSMKAIIVQSYSTNWYIIGGY